MADVQGPTVRREKQDATYRRATKVMPGGTDSNWRAWGEDTVYVDRGKGALVWDMDGNEYVDLRLGYGPVLLGHADPRVDDYVNERMRQGVSFSLTSEDEIQAVELITELTDKFLGALARCREEKPKLVEIEGGQHWVACHGR